MSLLERLRSAQSAWWLRSCDAVGAEPQLYGRPTVYAAPGRIRIGDRFRLWSHPVTSHLMAGPDAALDIGHDVSIGHGGGISAFEHVQIGDETSIGPYVLIMDTNFHSSTGAQSLQHDTRPVTIGRACRIGSRVTITRGAAIGDGSEILAGSVVSSAVPAGMCAGGARARVLGRAGDAACQWDSAAAGLPELIRDTLGLDAVPDLQTDASALPWDNARLQVFIDVVEHQFGATVAAAEIRGASRLADVVATVERRRRRRTSL